MYTIRILAGGAVAQHYKISVVFALRLILTQLRLDRERFDISDVQDVQVASRSFRHSQIGIGTGEDLWMYCYLVERLRAGPEITNLIELKQHLVNLRHGAGEVDEEDEVAQEEDAEDDPYDAYLHGFDFDRTSLSGCKKILKPISSRSCKLFCRDVFRLQSGCKSYTAVSTGCAGNLFFLCTLLYVLKGRTTKAFIFDDEGNLNAWKLVLKTIVQLMGYSKKYQNVVNVAAFTKATDKPPRPNKRGSFDYTKDAYLWPFLPSVLAQTEDIDPNAITEDQRRDLVLLNVDRFVDWMYKYLHCVKGSLDTALDDEMVNRASTEQKYAHAEVSFMTR
jgi:hypothetical protein